MKNQTVRPANKPNEELRRIVVFLRDEKEKTFEQIAEAIGGTRQNAHRLYVRAKEALEHGKVQNADTSSESEETTDLHRRWMHTTKSSG